MCVPLHIHTHMYDTCMTLQLPVAKGRSRVIVLEEEMTIDELAERMKISPSESVRPAIMNN